MNNDLSILFNNIKSENYLESDFAFRQGQIINRFTFIKHAIVLSTMLSNSKYIINLCEDRYLFSVLFIACLIKDKICLLPSSQVESEITNLKNKYYDCDIITDRDIEIEQLEQFEVNKIEPPKLSLSQLACVVFTSGSTGVPKANEKTWGTLLESAKLVAARLGLLDGEPHKIVATVPAQHMFGFEMSIMLPMVTNTLVHSGKPFFPEEVYHAMTSLHGKCILISTPIHLKACAYANIAWPEIEYVLSATANLELDLATEIEKQLKTRVKEIYGCSEAGAIATRVMTDSIYWELLPGYKINKNKIGFELIISGNDRTVDLHDNFDFNSKDQFILLGRESDMIKIGGKRGSLGDLKNKMCSISGVVDAVFFSPDRTLSNGRIAALVIASGIEEHEILVSLGKMVDPVFLPRPLIKVSEIPYNPTGKIISSKLIEIYERYKCNKHSVMS